jgi:hypothetical protein
MPALIVADILQKLRRAMMSQTEGSGRGWIFAYIYATEKRLVDK